MDTKRLQLLAHLEESVVEHGVGIVGVGADRRTPSFFYTVGLFEHGHPEFVLFEVPPAMGHGVLNDLAALVMKGGLRFQPHDRVHGVFVNAAAYMLGGPRVDQRYVAAARSIRDRRHPHRAHLPVRALQVAYSDVENRLPWEPGSAYARWPLFGSVPAEDSIRDVYIPGRVEAA